ncbi:unnamed protein product, partial [Dicrocoelium dendriticum]
MLLCDQLRAHCSRIISNGVFITLATMFPASGERLTFQFTLEMPEELSRGTTVAELDTLVLQNIPDIQLTHDQSAGEYLRFKFFEPNPSFYIHSVPPSKHYLRVNSRVDREAECSPDGVCCQFLRESNTRPLLGIHFVKSSEPEVCKLTLVLLVDIPYRENNQIDLKQALVQLTIKILDVNDNVPSWRTHSSSSVNVHLLNETAKIRQYFPPSGGHIPKIDFTIPEHTSIGTSIAVPLAVDPDAHPENTTSSYEIENQTVEGAFGLDWKHTQQLGDDPSKRNSGLWLVVNKDFVHGDPTEHHVVLRASDAGVPNPMTGYLLVNITITDVNDHPPKWPKTRDFIWVEEHVDLGTRIFWSNARDADPSDQGRLTYGFLPSTLVESRQLFHVDQKRGEISVKAPIDYEQTQLHRLFIFVSDGKWTDEMELDVFVTNLNDHPPEIQLHSHLASAQHNFGVYHADRSTFVSTQLTILVRENGPPEQLLATVTVTDKDLLAERQTAALARSIDFALKADANGNSMAQVHPNHPQCSLNNFQFKIEPLELDSMGAFTDKLRFQISLAGEPLDREKQSRIFVQVLCHDHPHTSEHVSNFSVVYQDQINGFKTQKVHSSTALLRILVEDENDSPPVFVGPHSTRLPENAYAETVVLHLKVLDADDPHSAAGNAGLRYRLLPDVIVKPETFAFIDETPNSKESSDAEEENALPPKPWFQINRVTGELKSLVSFDRELTKALIVAIEIRDGGDANWTTLAAEESRAVTSVNRVNITIAIELTDVNDCVPKFHQPLYEFSLSENTRPPIRIGKFNVTDCDVDETNRAVEYWLQQNIQPMGELTSKSTSVQSLPTSTYYTAWFSVSRVGELYLRTPPTISQSSGQKYSGILTPLDREQDELIVMDVFARDGGHPALTGSAQLVIRVLDVNDHAPEWEFPKPRQRLVNLSAETAVGNRIAHLVATDPDEGPRGMISYSILSGNEGGYFELDSNTGWVYLAQPLHQQNSISSGYTVQSEYQSPNALNLYSTKSHLSMPSIMRLYVQASDHGSPPRTSSSVLDILIHPPAKVQGSSTTKTLRQLEFREATGVKALNDRANRPSKDVEFGVSELNWPLNHRQEHRGFLLSSDFLTLIAMVIATLAALALIFVFFVILRCRKFKPATEMPSTARTARFSSTERRSNWHTTANFSTAVIPSWLSVDTSGKRSIEPPFSSKLQPSTFWSRLNFHLCPSRKTDARTLSNTAASHGLYEHAFGALRDVPSPESSLPGEALVYSKKSIPNTSHQQENDLLHNSTDYCHLLHSAHPLNVDNSGTICTRIQLNNEQLRSKNQFDIRISPSSKYQTFEPNEEISMVHDSSSQCEHEVCQMDKAVRYGSSTVNTKVFTENYTPLKRTSSQSKMDVRISANTTSF